MRFFSRRRALLALGILTIVLAAAIGGLIYYLQSPEFEARARRYIVEEIARQTGAKVTLGNFHWSFWEQRFRLEDLILRGLEPETHSPLAHFPRIDIGLHLWSLLERHIDLYELTVTGPEFHVLITPDGTTNFPSPQQSPEKPSGFQIAIDNFNVIDGSALLNERRVGFDLSLTRLTALLKYHNSREVLEAHLRYDGVVDRAPEVRLAIPYTLSADIDYTRATVLAQRITIKTGNNEIKLQGRVNQILSGDVSGRLEYSGKFQIPFLNYFFIEDKFSGAAAANGFLEFSKEKFATQGHVLSDAIDYEGWRVTAVSSDYAYQFPERLLRFTNLKHAFTGGSVSGEAVVEKLPGPSRVQLNLNYANIDAAGLTRAYPWNPKYRIFSRATGTLKGWFEGKLARFDLSGHVDLNNDDVAATTAIVALPLVGSTDYNLTPGAARVANADLHFYSTALKADGLIQDAMSDLKIDLASSDFKDLAFIYPDANGSGTFNGWLTGKLAQPLLNGQFTLQNHAYREWKIEHASGGVRLDMATESANLRDVHVRQGNSEVVINGTTALSGSPVDLRVQSNAITAQDLRPFVNGSFNRDFSGTFAGDVHVTGLTPEIKVEGDVRADNLSVDNRLIGNVRGRVRFFDPLLDINALSIRQADSTLNGNLSFNRVMEAVSFAARINSLDLRTFRSLGLPDTIEGIVQQADLRGSGTLRQPKVDGNATLQNLNVNGEVFSEAHLNLASNGTKLNLEMDGGKNLKVEGQVDTAAAGYPFNANLDFTDYPLQRLANFSGGTITASGSADLSGSLTDTTRLQGTGRIDRAAVQIQDTIASPAQPFTFTFNSTQVRVYNVTLTGPSTQVTFGGAIGLREPAPLDLNVVGQVDLKLIETRIPELVSSGSINLQVNVRGTTQNPDLRGSGTLTNASLRRPGFFTGLTNVNGTLSFNQNQIRLEKIQGTAGGGTVNAEGTAVLQGNTIQGMAVLIDAKSVRLRGYPEGLRSVIDAQLNLRGSLSSPSLEGNVQIQSLAYRSGFEDFLALLRQENLLGSPAPLGSLRLGLHIEGGKNITIQNQLAEVEARVDLDWKGTIDQPAITGHIEASGGTLTFQGNRYTVTRGNIDLIDPLGIQPVIDIEAESQVRDYRVILTITGRGDNPKLSMRSDPPLPELEIVSLIAGGRTREEIAARSATAPTSERLFQSGAASILFDLLQQRVGNRLGLLGTGRVRIDPFLVGTQNNPGARITLSEQVTKDLSVTYSQDLSSNRQQVILIEYFISRDSSIVASRDEFGNFGLDLRHRTRIK